MPTGMRKGYQSEIKPEQHHLVPEDHECVNRYCKKTKADGARFGVASFRKNGKPHISKLCNSCAYDKSKKARIKKIKQDEENSIYNIEGRREKIAKDIKDYFAKKEYNN